MSQPSRITGEPNQLCPATVTRPRTFAAPGGSRDASRTRMTLARGLQLKPLNDSLNVDLISTISAGSNDAINHLAVHRTFRPLRQLPTLGLHW